MQIRATSVEQTTPMVDLLTVAIELYRTMKEGSISKCIVEGKEITLTFQLTSISNLDKLDIIITN